MKKVKYNDTYIYIDDNEVDIKETGVVIRDDEDLDKTQEFIVKKDNLEDTLTDILSENDEH